MPTNLFGLSENPFFEGHDPRSAYPARAHREVVARLRRGLENREPFALVTGLPGVGRTLAIQAALAGAGPHVLVCIPATPTLGREDFRERVLSGFGPAASDATSPGRAADGIEARLRAVRASGRLAILVVLEAQDLSHPLMEDLRLLSNLEAGGDVLLQIVLEGQPGLDDILSRPDCDALRQRIALRCRLDALSAEETEDYIRHRVALAGGDALSLFTVEACQALHRLTHGIPGEINRLATEALSLANTAGEESIAAGHIACAAVMLGFRSAGKDSQPTADEEQPVEVAVEAVEFETLEPPRAAEVEVVEVVEAVETVERAAAVEPVVAVEAAASAGAEPGPVAYDGPVAGLSTMRDVGLPASSEVPLPEPAEMTRPVVEATTAPTASGEPLAAPAPAGPAAKAAPAQPQGAEVDAWLARFRDPGGPPRIGSRLAVATTAADALEPRTIEAPVEQPATEAPARTEPRRGAHPRERSRRAGHPRKSATWAMAALLLVIAAGLVIVKSSRSLVPSLPSARPTIEEPVAQPEPPRTVSASVTRPALVPVPRAATAAQPRPRVEPEPSPVPAVPRHAPAAASASPAPAESHRAPSAPSRLFGVEVATYLSENRAVAERDRLAARISLPCRVVTSSEDGYVIVVGPFANPKEAVRLSEDLSERGVVEQARVVRWAASDTTHR